MNRDIEDEVDGKRGGDYRLAPETPGSPPDSCRSVWEPPGPGAWAGPAGRGCGTGGCAPIGHGTGG